MYNPAFELTRHLGGSRFIFGFAVLSIT